MAASTKNRQPRKASSNRQQHKAKPVVQEPTAAPASSALWWLAWIGLSAAYLRPVLSTTLVSDDFVNPFSQFDVTGGGLWQSLVFAQEGVERTGHFNIVGQCFGALWNQLWLAVASRTQISIAQFYGFTKLLVYLLAALAVAGFVRAVACALGRQVSPWHARVLVSIALFGTLQLHLWSHDPVASFPLAGFASAAIGFGLLTAALRWARPESKLGPAAVGMIGTLAILYYEINVAAVVAVGFVLLWRAAALPTLGEGARVALRLSPAVLIPAVVTVALQSRAAPASANYSGTTLDAGDGLVNTLAVTLVSGLPGAGWSMSRTFLAGAPKLLPLSLLVFAVVLVVLLLLARRPLPSGAVGRLGRGWLLLVAPVVYAILATAIQASTSKVQAEVTEVGEVYLFYAMSACAVAAVAVLALLLVPQDWLTRRAVVVPLAVGVGSFILMQTMINASIAPKFYRDVLPQNSALLDAYSDEAPVAERCAQLERWTSIGWPEYYSTGMVNGLQEAYQHYQGEPFCPGFVLAKG